MKHRYRYEGPVLECDRLICLKWRGETIASSEKSARNNLAFQFKKGNKREKNARISLPGRIKELEAIL